MQSRINAWLQGGAVSRRLPILNIQHGASAADAIGMPVAAWLLGECMLKWAGQWQPPQVRATPTQAILSLSPYRAGCQPLEG